MRARRVPVEGAIVVPVEPEGIIHHGAADLTSRSHQDVAGRACRARCGKMHHLRFRIRYDRPQEKTDGICRNALSDQ